MSGEANGNGLAAALVAAQEGMPAVEKNAKANYGKYATLDSLIAKTRPHLLKHGLSINQYPEVNEAGLPVLRTTISHVSGETRSSLMPLYLTKQDMQALGSAITYARRYAWAAALGIASEEDDDGKRAAARGRGDARVAVRADVDAKVTSDVSSPRPPAAESPAPAGVRANCDHPPDSIVLTDDDKYYQCRVCGQVMLSRAQMAKIHATIRELDGHGDIARAPIPEPWKTNGDGEPVESWVQVLKLQLEAVGVSSRKQLSGARAHALIEWLEAQRVPFS